MRGTAAAAARFVGCLAAGAVTLSVAVTPAAAATRTPAVARHAAATHSTAHTTAHAVAATRSSHYTLRLASGSTRRAVKAGAKTFQADRYYQGGHIVTRHAKVAILRHGRTGGTYRVPVPYAGRYQIALLIPTATTSRATVDVVVQRKVVRQGVAISRARRAGATAVTVVFLASTNGNAITVRLRGHRAVPTISALQLQLIPAEAPVPAATPIIPNAPVVTPGVPAGPGPVRAIVADPFASVVPGNVTWKSGAYPGNTIDTTAIDAFGTYRGRAADVATMFQIRDSWDTIAHNSWAIDQYNGFAGKLSIGVPLIPTDGSTTLAQVASGAHDADFASFAKLLLAAGRGDSDIRLGWEFNGNFQPWAAWDAPTFVAAFRHAALAMKAVAPDLTIDYNGNLGVSQCGNDPFGNLYPGDDVVDVIGVDAYDNHWNTVTDAASWSHFHSQTGGLDDWYAFAQQHGKPLSVPEWGLDKDGGADNPYYVKAMFSWFQSHASGLAFESYFNEPADYIASSLEGPDQNPNAASAYATLWG
ncbi:MAG TPA: hypothetical protein VHE83_13610 [Mycobacteriales bacterium]|nr:hypothetical protein [Mycobacteriales bacterium]